VDNKEREILEAVRAGKMTVEEANEQLYRCQPLRFAVTPRGLVQIEGLMEKRFPPQYTPMEWRRILARAADIVAGLEKIGA
jgi:hypothetical protein